MDEGLWDWMDEMSTGFGQGRRRAPCPPTGVVVDETAQRLVFGGLFVGLEHTFFGAPGSVLSAGQRDRCVVDKKCAAGLPPQIEIVRVEGTHAGVAVGGDKEFLDRAVGGTAWGVVPGAAGGTGAREGGEVLATFVADEGQIEFVGDGFVGAHDLGSGSQGSLIGKIGAIEQCAGAQLLEEGVQSGGSAACPGCQLVEEAAGALSLSSR